MQKEKIDNLKGKRVLMFCPKFFNYQELIKIEIENQGATVHLYDERNNPSSIEKMLLRKTRFLVEKKISKFYSNVIEKESRFDPDYIFFVNIEAAGKTELKKLHKKFPDSKFVLYMWDSSKNKSNLRNILTFFDKKFSFDRDDCEKYGMQFRPLFYSESVKVKNNKNNFKYDVSFIGTIHSDRAKILYQIKKYCEKNNLSYYFYLYVPGGLLLFLRMIFTVDLKKWGKKYIHTIPLDKNKVSEISNATRCVIDINHPDQTGLTMRTIEMLGLKRKMMTTNSNIRAYDFYRSENQFIIDRNNFSLDINKLKNEYVNIPDDIYKKYSLKNWVDDIFQ